MTLLLISFIAGVLTVLAPCILPLLPVIIGGSFAEGGNKYKSATIIGSLIISIVLFTLILKWSTAFISVPPMVWSYISGAILILVSISIIFPDLWNRLPFVSKLSIGSNKVMGAGYQKKSFWGDVIVGAALGPVFSSCSPTYFLILATVLPQSFGKGLIDLFAYALGLGLILLLVAFLGQKVVDKLGGVSDSKGWFKRTLGILFLLVGIFVITGLDKKLEATLINKGYTGWSSLENKFLKINDTQTRAANVNPLLATNSADIAKNQQTLAVATSAPKQNKNDIDSIRNIKSKLYEKYHEIVRQYWR
jgi:cytochrome c-type biogenesis protein